MINPQQQSTPPSNSALENFSKNMNELLVAAAENVGRGIEAVIEKIAAPLNAATKYLHEETGKIKLAGGGGGSSGSNSNLDFSPSKQDAPVKSASNKAEQSIVPEKQISMSSPSSSKPIYENVSMADCGNLCAPHTPYQMAATKSQGISI